MNESWLRFGQMTNKKLGRFLFFFFHLNLALLFTDFMYRNESKRGKHDCRSIKINHNRGAMIGWGERQSTKKYALVVVHFEDTAFDDAHVSVPYHLVSEGHKRETEREPTVSENSKAVLICYDKLLLWNLAKEAIFAYSVYEYLFVRLKVVQCCANL